MSVLSKSLAFQGWSSKRHRISDTPGKHRTCFWGSVLFLSLGLSQSHLPLPPGLLQSIICQKAHSVLADSKFSLSALQLQLLLSFFPIAANQGHLQGYGDAGSFMVQTLLQLSPLLGFSSTFFPAV